MVSATILADGAARNVTRAAYAPGPAWRRGPRRRPLGRGGLPGRDPGTGSRRATDGNKADPGEEPAAVHASHPA